MLVVIIGKPGSGKTTLANHLRDSYGFTKRVVLPGKRVPAAKRVVVDWLPYATLDDEPLMTSGRRLSGHVELLGGIVIETNQKKLSGIGVALPSGGRGVDDGRLLRTADMLMKMLAVGKPSRVRKAGSK